MDLTDHFVELITRTSTDLPSDVEDKLKKQTELEVDGSPAKATLKTILQNVSMAREEKLPICQDTGALVFYINYPPSLYKEQDFTGKINLITGLQFSDFFFRHRKVESNHRKPPLSL